MPWSPRRPPRLSTFGYCGLYSYFVTCCTDARAAVFTAPAVVGSLREIVLHSAAERFFVVNADIWMPDHLHMILTACRPQGNFLQTMKLIRQRTAIAWSGPGRLWQDAYYDHVIRPEEPLVHFVEYIVMNPVDAGLVADPAQYPFL